jgi:hypothetical protein
MLAFADASRRSNCLNREPSGTALTWAIALSLFPTQSLARHFVPFLGIAVFRIQKDVLLSTYSADTQFVSRSRRPRQRHPNRKPPCHQPQYCFSTRRKSHLPNGKTRVRLAWGQAPTRCAVKFSQKEHLFSTINLWSHTSFEQSRHVIF